MTITDVRTDEGLTVSLTRDIVLAPREQRQVRTRPVQHMPAGLLPVIVLCRWKIWTAVRRISTLPVRVTTLDGALLYDPDRAEVSQVDGPYVAMRTPMSSRDVLVWYHVDDRLRGIMPAVSSATTPTLVTHSWLRTDSTAIAEGATGDSVWAAVDMVTPAGTPAPVKALW